MRNLASIQKIKDILPIDGADRIELARILGWQCVVKKGEFNPGDLCVYFEIDSFLPIRQEFEFLRANSYKKNELLGEGFRLKTQRMRGQISQGLAMPVSLFENMLSDVDIKEGADVTEALGVKKWEMPEMATSGGTTIGSLPGYVHKTDETRVQNVPDIIKEFNNLGFYITTKMDGSSHTISVDEEGFHVCGHNYEYKDDGKSSFYEYCKNNGFIEKMVSLRKESGWKTLVFQGEWCGPGMQKNRLKLTQPQWYVFDVYVDGKRLSWSDICLNAQIVGCETVPLEEIEKDISLGDRYKTMDDILSRAIGEYPNGGPKEGIVIRPLKPVWSDTLGDMLSIKAINNNYLLKEKD